MADRKSRPPVSASFSEIIADLKRTPSSVHGAAGRAVAKDFESLQYAVDFASTTFTQPQIFRTDKKT